MASKANSNSQNFQINKIPDEKIHNSLAQDITNRYRVTAREAKDIVSSIASAVKQPSKATTSNVAKQVAETAKAAATGKSGTTAGYVGQAKGVMGGAKGGEANTYRKGTNR